MDTNIFSIIILSFNSKRYLNQALDSINCSVKELAQQTEVFIIDNGSIDGSVDILKNYQFDTPLIHYNPIFLDQNFGTTYSRNLGLQKATGDFIVIMDSDAYMNPEVMENLKQYLSDHPECGLVAPKLIYPNGKPQLSVDQFPTLYNKFKRFFFLKQIEQRSQIVTIQPVDYAISAFWMIKKEAFNKTGCLDEKIFYSPEDVDYCIRIWKHGYKVVYNPTVSIVHDAQEISRPKGFKIINKFTLSHLKGLIYLFIKHNYLFSTKKLRSS